MSSLVRTIVRPIYFVYILLVGLVMFVCWDHPRHWPRNLVLWSKLIGQSWQDSELD